ncbi:MAG: hypothetical protein KAH44_32310 [Oricola sp.]|jgi:hypothetical protein|nr:hypothetical protein [Oricola sp.]
MFIVKQLNDRGARLWETTMVHYVSSEEAAPGLENVNFVTSDGDYIQLESGSIYLMNENGKTIDQYHFYQTARAEEDGVIKAETGHVSSPENSSALAA